MSQYDLPRHRNQTGEEPWNTPNLAVNSQYPPQNNVYGSQSTVFDKSAINLAGPTISRRNISRTPSPTPSEAKEMKTGAFDWETLSNWRFWIRKEWIGYYVAFVILCTLTALMTIYHHQIVDWLTPVTRWMHDLKFGWLVPIGILFVISFPPLFGHEIVAILCGLVWGLWIGFGIVAAGTFIGEVGNFYAFKYCCRARGEKMERTKIIYACLAKVVRDGGFKIALIARLSAIPGHFTTAVFSTCGMGIIVFSIAAILSLPKQFITVYLGVILEQSSTGTEDPKSRIISDIVLAITFLITIVAMWYIYHKMNQVKPEVIYARRKARQAKMQGGGSPYTSEVSIPLSSPKPQYAFSSPQNQFGSSSPKRFGSPHASIVYAPSPSNAAYEYKPSNNYGYDSDDASSSNHTASVEQYQTPYRTPPANYQTPAGLTSHSMQSPHSPTPQSPYSVSAYGGGSNPYVGSRSEPGYASPNPYVTPNATSSRNPYTSSPNPYTSSPQLQASSPTGYIPQSLPNPYMTASQSAPHPYTVDNSAYAETAYISEADLYSSPRRAPAPEEEPLTPRAAAFHHAAEPTGMSYHTAMGSEHQPPPGYAI